MPKILLVDDHPDTVHVYATLLRRAGHVVTVAMSYREALQAIKSDVPEVVLCDIGLPDGDGCDLIRELHQQHDVACIAVTGYVLEKDRVRYIEAGFAECLPKPCNMEQMSAAIARALRPD